MKKLVAMVLTVLTCGSVYALPIGNPSEPGLYLNGLCGDAPPYCNPCDPNFCWCDIWSVRVGFYGDYVFNRHLEIDRNHLGDDLRGSSIDETSLSTNAGYLALNLGGRVDIFSTLGASKLFIHTGLSSFGFTLEESFAELYFQTRFSWSVGARAILWEYNCFTVGIEGQYFSTTPHVDSFFNYSDGALTHFNGETNNRRVKYQEWQAGVGLSYRFATNYYPIVAMVPYAGLKWSWAKLKFHHDFTFLDAVSGETFTLHDLKANKVCGYAIGMTFVLYDLIGVNVEGRWADEKAVSVLAQFRF